MPNTNEIVTVTSDGEVVVADTTFINTLGTGTTKAKVQAFNAYNNASSLATVGDAVLHVCDVITTPGIRRSRDANIPDAPCQNTYLITKDGNAYMTQSAGIADSINKLVQLFPQMGKDTDEGCIDLQVVETTLANGNTLKRIQIV